MELNDTMQYGLGSVTGFAETDDYFMAVDANSRMLVFWTKDGTEIGYLEDSDLFGTNYPWMGSLCKAADGSFYISLVERRPDGSWDELVVYQMTITKN